MNDLAQSNDLAQKNLAQCDGESFSKFKTVLRSRFGDSVFGAWMADLVLERITDTEITLASPSAVKVDRLNQQYRRGMLKVIREDMPALMRLDIVERRNLRNDARRAAEKSALPRNGFFSQDVARADVRSSWGGVRAGADVATSRDQGKTGGMASLAEMASSVDPRASFEGLAVDTSNMLAVAAARQVLAHTGGFDVVYIYGASGCGKTHILHAIANESGRAQGASNIAYFSYQDIRDCCALAARTSKLADLHRRLEEAEILLIDDIHLLQSCTRTQEEILNLVNTFPTKGRRLVIAGELPPTGLRELGMNVRLSERLAGGVPAPIEPADDDLRREVLMKRRAETSMACAIGDEAIDFIATHFRRSVREAIGALNQVLLLYRERPVTVGVADVRAALKARLRDAADKVTMDELLSATADVFELSVDDLTGRAQPQRIVRARHAFVLIGRQSLSRSFPQLSRKLKRDHTTAMSSYERATALHERQEAFRERVSEIRVRLGLPEPSAGRKLSAAS